MPELIKGGRLTKTVFAEGIGLISARWNREIDPQISAVMAEWLADHACTADEFITGVKRAIAEDEWPPNAKRILDLARPEPGPDARAGEAFDKIRRLGKYVPPHGVRWSLDEIERECGEPARRALVSIGGPRRLADMTEESVPFVLKEFSKAFVDFDRELASRKSASTLLTRGEQRRLLTAGES